MQQMTNILLPKAANNNASAGKASTPETRSEDFSAALASVNSVSSSTQKPSTSQERAIELTKSASSNDISQDEEDDVSLIFAQISMANEMKKRPQRATNCRYCRKWIWILVLLPLKLRVVFPLS